jgi:hypothetical protein
MNIVLSHVLNSAIAHPRLIGTKLFGGSFNGSLAHLKWLRKAQDGSLRAGEIVTYVMHGIIFLWGF